MPDGVVRYLSISGEPRFGADGRFLGYRGVGRDVTEIALARERIASLAYSDPLTGLANRTSLGPSLEQAVQRARRSGSKLAVVFLDLDGFKQINDLHGHDAGDALLVELAGRLRAQPARERPGRRAWAATSSWWCWRRCRTLAPVETVAKQAARRDARGPTPCPAREVGVTASIGISVFPDDAADARALMKHADSAMYAAKQAGKNCLALLHLRAGGQRAGARQNPQDAARRRLAAQVAVGVLRRRGAACRAPRASSAAGAPAAGGRGRDRPRACRRACAGAPRWLICCCASLPPLRCPLPPCCACAPPAANARTSSSVNTCMHAGDMVRGMAHGRPAV